MRGSIACGRGRRKASRCDDDGEMMTSTTTATSISSADLAGPLLWLRMCVCVCESVRERQGKRASPSGFRFLLLAPESFADQQSPPPPSPRRARLWSPRGSEESMRSHRSKCNRSLLSALRCKRMCPRHTSVYRAHRHHYHRPRAATSPFPGPLPFPFFFRCLDLLPPLAQVFPIYAPLRVRRMA